MLWGIFDNEASKFIDTRIVESVKTAFNCIGNTLEAGENPVAKVPIVVTNMQGGMMLAEVECAEGNGNGNDDHNRSDPSHQSRNRFGRDSNDFQYIYSVLNTLKNENMRLKDEVEKLKSTTKTQLQLINSSIVRLIPVATYRSGQAANRHSTGGNPSSARRGVTFTSSLCKNPRTLHVLWDEWEFGCGGRKAAKNFTSRERGASRSIYSFRRGFWDLCCNLIARGHTRSTAIDEIYRVYGRGLSVTQILRQINRDKKEGGHILLRE